MNIKKMRPPLIPVLLLLVICEAGFSQGFDIPLVDGFKKELNYPVYTPDDLWDYINGGADSYNALGFVDLNIIEYKKGKKNSVKLEVYRHRNPEMAFGIYALERAPSYDFNDIGVQGYSGEGFTNFFKDVYYIKIYTHSKSKKALSAVNEIARSVEIAIEGSESFPAYIESFPKEGKLPNEEMFVSENVIGHGFLSDAFRASYEIEGKRFVIYLFARESPEEINVLVQKYLERQNLDTDMKEGKSAFKDGYNGDIFLAWAGNRMVLISGLKAKDAAMADRYISNTLDK